MAVKLKDMLDREKVLQVHWDGEVVDVCILPNAVTPTFLETVDVAAARDDLSVLAATWLPVVQWWDILQGNGKRLPVTEENVMKLPMSFLNALQKAVDLDTDPPDEERSDAS